MHNKDTNEDGDRKDNARARVTIMEVLMKVITRNEVLARFCSQLDHTRVNFVVSP